MNITNKNNTPQIMMDVLNAPSSPRVGGSDYSPVSLIMSPRQVQLIKRHGDSIPDDAADLGAMFIGSAIHSEIERGLKKYPEKYLVEQKFYDVIQDRKIAAVVDAVDLETNTVYDHKKSGTYQSTFPPKLEWEQQLNLYGYFLNKEGIQPERMFINAVYPDWSKSKAQYSSGDYPTSWGQLFDIPVWTFEEQEQFINDRISAHVAAESLSDDALPYCTDTEMWAKEPSFAVKVPGVERAKRVLSTREEAETWLKMNNRSGNMYIEERPGERTKCENWCKVKHLCNQYKEYVNAR